MKGLLAVIFMVGAAAAEDPAPYAPSGWRPSGPAFELPQRGQNPNYLPPVDPRIPARAPDADVDVTVQGLPPRQEQQPIFSPSPISGQQYVGPTFNADVRSLDQGLNQAQFQVQQQKAREFARQRQENEARLSSTNTPNQFIPRTTVNPTQRATPRPEFKTTTATTDLDLNEGETDEIGSPAVADKQRVSIEVTKQNIQEYPPELFLNPLAQLRLQPLQFGQSPVLMPGQQFQKQVTGFDAEANFAALPSIIAQQQLAQQQLDQQRALLQQYPGNLVVSGQTSNRGFLIPSPQALQRVTQLQPLVQPSPIQGQNVVLQPQGVNQVQPNEQPRKDQSDDDDDDDNDDNNQPRQPVQPQFGFQPQPQLVYQQQPQPQALQPQGFQPQGFQQPQLIYQPQAQQPQVESVYQQEQQVYQQPQQILQQAYPQPVQPAFQPQYQTQDQPQVYQPQSYQPQTYQPQTYQHQTYQPKTYQPQTYQSETLQPQTYQPQTYQPQLIYAPDQQQGQLVSIPAQNVDQFYQQQQQLQQLTQGQGQDALQSGFDVNQQGNSLDQTDKDDDANTDERTDGATATAVATAFGTRTQPRAFTRYGAPVQRAQNAATTESPAEEVTTEEGPAIAQATAVARGSRRKSAKLRSRLLRPDSPIFTLDKSGRLVLVSEQ